MPRAEKSGNPGKLEKAIRWLILCILCFEFEAVLPLGNASMALISRLPEGPLDIVGDVHGELQALDGLMRRLGYDAAGRHAGGRRLVFLGDLCDRGPDSPGVLQRVKRIVDNGHGCCVLGNHELNLLRQTPKHGNGWFFAEEQDHDRKNGEFPDCRRLPQGERAAVLEFLRNLPLALERDDLRVVHACWHAASIEVLRSSPSADVLQLYQDSELRVLQSLEGTELGAQADAEAALFEPLAADRSRLPPPAPNLARRDELYQNGNPVRNVTSGPERLAAEAFFSAGKWRLLERVHWWQEYQDSPPVIFGHYWRVPAGMAQPANKGLEDVLDGYADADWLGPHRRAFCADYCVGARYLERLHGVRDGFESRLAALRWPECLLLMDDGRTLPTDAGFGPSSLRPPGP
jgi:hypothetical protein